MRCKDYTFNELGPALAPDHARHSSRYDAAMRARIQAILPWNLGGLFASVLGLMCVVVGVILA